MTTTSPRLWRPGRRPGCGPVTWPGWPASGCGPASCAPGCPRWASRSASRRSSPSWAWPPPPRPRCWPRSSALGTNLLTVTNGQTLTGATAELPAGGAGHDRPAARRHRGAGHRHRQRRQRLQVPAHPRGRNQRAQRGCRHPGPARGGRHQRWPRAGSSTPPPPASRSRCSAPPPPSGWASTGSGPGCGSGSAARGST